MKKTIFTVLTVLVLSACTPKTSMSPSAADNANAKRPEASVVASPNENPVDDVKESSHGAMRKDGSYQFKLSSLNNSGREGWAYIKEDSGKVKVTLDLLESKTATAVAQPAHIHVGLCPEPGAVKYPLTNVVNGKSETTLTGVTLSSLMALAESEEGLSINVHKSAADLPSYVACGDLTFKKGTTMKNDAAASNAARASARASAKAVATPKPSATQ